MGLPRNVVVNHDTQLILLFCYDDRKTTPAETRDQAKSAARNVAICGLALAPLAAQMLTPFLERWTARKPPSARETRIAGILMPIASVVVAVVVALGLLRNPARTDHRPVPLAQIAALAQRPGIHRLFCMDFAWCSGALGRPSISVFIDGRADPYPPAIWQTYAKITFLHPGWRAAIDANHIDSVLVKVGSALDQGMARRPEWRAFAVDRNYRLWIRRPRSYAVSRLTPPRSAFARTRSASPISVPSAASRAQTAT